MTLGRSVLPCCDVLRQSAHSLISSLSEVADLELHHRALPHQDVMGLQVAVDDAD